MTPEQEAAAREAFEALISAPPFERNVDRWPNDPTKYGWPDAYKSIDIALAWQAYLAATERLLGVVAERDAALIAIRKAAGSGKEFTNRLQFIHARAGCAIDGLPWTESDRKEFGYTIRDRTLIENDELRQRLADLERQLALMRACVDAADAIRARVMTVSIWSFYDAARALIGEQK